MTNAELAVAIGVEIRAAEAHLATLHKLLSDAAKRAQDLGLLTPDDVQRSGGTDKETETDE